MKKILLIGGCGFIGHNLAIHLKKLNFDVTIVDGLSVNNLYNFKDNIGNNEFYRTVLNNRLDLLNENKINYQITDARDYHALSKLISSYKPDFIIHLAAVSHANKSNKDPHSTFDHSLRTLENALDASRSVGAHFIYLSSSMVYGNFDGETVEEDRLLNPIGIYGTLKMCGEYIVKSYNQVFDLTYTIIRPSALYGERCVSRRVGQIFIENAIRGQKIIINGDGSEKLDFTYIKDFIQGIALCINSKNAKNQIFNLTYGEGRSINQLIEILKKEFPSIEIETKDREKFTPERGTLSVEKAKKLIDYKPSYPIEKGYIEYINWYSNFFKDKFKK